VSSLHQPTVPHLPPPSVSACHGAGNDPISPTCYPSLFFSWWNSIFPHPDSHLTNGALRLSSSKYFAFCNMHHLPDATDLVVLELDVDDSGYNTPPDALFFLFLLMHAVYRDAETSTYFELLVRSILIRPEAPAVLILGHFSPQVR
jgi:hypothetical protein